MMCWEKKLINTLKRLVIAQLDSKNDEIPNEMKYSVDHMPCWALVVNDNVQKAKYFVYLGYFYVRKEVERPQLT